MQVFINKTMMKILLYCISSVLKIVDVFDVSCFDLGGSIEPPEDPPPAPQIRHTKLRLSNHKLAIETGRYSRPFKKPAERICPVCKIEMEDEYHFLNICPAYQEKRCSLLDYLEKEYGIKISRMSPNRIFMFLINPPSGNVRIQKLIAKHIFECFEKRKGEDG